MPTYKVYKHGNYLEIIDTENGQLWNTNVKNARIFRHDMSQEWFDFYDTDKRLLSKIFLTNICDQAGDTYTLEAFEEFIKCSFGFSVIGTACEGFNVTASSSNTESALTWEPLAPYLINSFVALSPPSKQPEFAYDTYKKLLYFRGLLSVASSPASGTEIANIPDSVFNNDKFTAVYLPVFRSTSNTFVAVQVGDLGGVDTFSINYASSVLGENVIMTLDSLPVIRFD